MKKSRIFSIFIPLFILLSYATCFGQSSYMGLTPGKSTRADVEKVLGPRTSQVTEHLLEYRDGGKEMYVQYSKETLLAIRIQVVYSPGVARPEILSTVGLPAIADSRRTNKNGALEEYFANPHYIVLTYEDNSQTQVSQVGYYSRQLFENVTPELPRSPSASPATTPTKPGTETRPVDIPSLNATVVSLRFYVVGADQRREYKTRFAKSETRRIGYELILQHPAPGHRIEYSIDSVWHRDGVIFHMHKFDVWIEPDWIQSTPVYAVGWDEPGNWTVGSYLVELFISGRKMASGLFDVY